MKTLYDLLGVDAGATQAQIEQGYKRQLDRYLERQDANARIDQRASQHDSETRRMQNIREAYLLLCSPPKRQIYDQQLKMFQKARAQIFSRSNLFRAALLALGVLAVAAGIYMSHTMRDQAWNHSASTGPATVNVASANNAQTQN
jgi:hypothetical protein